MSQNNIIAGAIIFGFVVYITMKGRLPNYLDLFKMGKQPTVSSSTQQGSSISPSSFSDTSSPGDTVQSAIDNLAIA